MAKTKNIRLVIIPRDLSHFTTVSGLLGILDSHSLWASNVSFLNDKKELIHGIDTAIDALEQFTSVNERILADIRTDLLSKKLPDTYVTCFCKHDDVLSQWRGYAGKQQGVSITFNGLQLRALYKEKGGVPMEVIYDRERTQTRFVNILKKQFEDFDDFLNISTEAEMRKELLQKIARMAPRFKDDGFREENEWRFVIQRNDDYTDVKLRESDGIIIPYIPINHASKSLLPITRVTVGPGKNQELTIKSIELALKLRGYKNVKVKPSSVPYRT